MRSAPKVYTLPVGRSFVDQLAEGVLQRVGDDPLALSSTIILLPNRRAARSLREAFLRKTGGKPTLLPTMRALGDTEEGEIEFLGAGIGLKASAILPPIEATKRQVYLTKLVQQWQTGISVDEPMAPAQAWRFAGELARFLDQVDTEDLDLENLKDVVPDNLAQHWLVTIEFLKIISETWPAILADEKAQNPARYRNQSIRAIAEIYKHQRPDTHVIAAGSTGTIPATAELLSVVARLPNGAVVLPGFDAEVDEETWEAISESHPQSAMKSLLNFMGVSRFEVDPWIESVSPAHTQRLNLMSDSMLPAALTGRWQRANYRQADSQTLLQGVDTIVAPGRREEAEAIALAMRETLETPGKTAALVTPDRQLALYVRAALRRWGVEIDDSGGDKAINTQPGRLLALLAAAVSDDFGPLKLLSLLQHPFVCAGENRQPFLAHIRKLDARVLRGVRPAGGLNGLCARAASLISDKKNGWNKEDQAKLDAIADMLRPLESALQKPVSLEHALTVHVSVAEKLCANADEDGAAILWRGDAGQALSDHLSDLMQYSALLTVDAAAGYAPFFNEIMQPATVRPSWNKHPRLAIWGPLEARLQQADLMIIGGVNEGVWPGEPAADPWMNNDMRLAFGLPSLDRRIGQAAHDFMLAISAPNVLLTRSDKTDGTPTIPSRWWLRLEALLGKALPTNTHYLEWAEKFSEAESVEPILPPKPTPPTAARPRTLSVTQIQEWMRDPYALYAKKILSLKVRDPIDDKPNASTKGTMLHEALELFLTEDGSKSGAAGLERLLSIGHRVFEPVITQPAVYAFWWPRFERIANWFVSHHEARSQSMKVALIEGSGKYSFTLPNGLEFTLEARADRIDENVANGQLEIIDYKTGTTPTSKQIEAGYAPQLPLEGMLAQLGAFKDIPARDVSDLIYWKISGGDPVQEAKRPIRDVPSAIASAREGLIKLATVFDHEDTAYLSNPRPDVAGYGDYDHLARVKEWRETVTEIQPSSRANDGPTKGTDS